MECKTCGRNTINSEANFCDYCGSSFRILPKNDKDNNQEIKPVEAENEKPISVFNYLWSMSLMFIPIIGPLVYIVMLLVWSFNKETPKNKQNWSKAMLIFMLVSLAFFIASFATLIKDPAFQNAINETMKMYNVK